MQIIVLGCGRVGSNLAARLMQLDHDVVVVEQDPVLLNNIADLDCVKIRGLVFDKTVLEKAGIETADAVCCVTNNENVNIMAAEVCQKIYHLDRVLVRTFLTGNTESFESMGLQTISGTEIIVNHFLHELRASSTSAAIDLYRKQIRFYESPVEAVMAGRSCQYVTNMIHKHVFACLRQGELLLSQSDLILEAGDILVIAEMEA